MGKFGDRKERTTASEAGPSGDEPHLESSLGRLLDDPVDVLEVLLIGSGRTIHPSVEDRRLVVKEDLTCRSATELRHNDWGKRARTRRPLRMSWLGADGRYTYQGSVSTAQRLKMTHPFGASDATSPV